MKRIIGIGNALVDALAQVSDEVLQKDLHLPKGGMQLVDTPIRLPDAMGVYKYATGGSACNTILALGHLDANPAIIGKIGNDVYGQFFHDNCMSHGIRPFLLRDELPTGVASTFITPDGQRTFGTCLGAAANLQPEDINPEWLEDYDYLYIEGYLVQNHALVDRIVQLARERSMKICLDLASYNIILEDYDYFLNLLKSVDIVFANEGEARAISGGKSPRAAIDELSRYCETSIVKIGPEGAMAKQGSEFVKVPARPVEKVIDSTGAGDFFAAGFLYGHSRGDRLSECVRKASILAAYVIEEIGTDLPEPVWDAIRREVSPLKALHS